MSTVKKSMVILAAALITTGFVAPTFAAGPIAGGAGLGMDYFPSTPARGAYTLMGMYSYIGIIL